MKHFAFLFLMMSSLVSLGQITVIVNPPQYTACHRDSLALTTIVTGPRPYSYRWQKEGTDIQGANDSILPLPRISIQDTGIYRCIVTNGVLSDTSNEAHIGMYDPMVTDTLYRYNELGCRYQCKGQFLVRVTGGYPPYDYNWRGGKSFDTLVIGLCPGKYLLTVTDTMGCTIDTTYIVEALKSPEIDFSWIPERDTIYLSNPTITVSFSDTAYPYIQNYEWEFGDSARVANVNPVAHTYTSANQDPFWISLNITDQNGCDTVVSHEIYVKVAQLFIPNVFTPYDGAPNNTFEIKILKGEKSYEEGYDFSEIYLSNELTIYDRWGKKVYQKSNYRSGDWDGGNLAEGTYFYVLVLTGQYGVEKYHGSVTLIARRTN